MGRCNTGSENEPLASGQTQSQTLPAPRALLDLPFGYVLVSHGEPVHARADFEAALDREPWSRPSDSL